MFAVIKTGGKQYRVSQGDKLRVESLDVDEGDSINIDEVLMVSEGESVTVGTPLVSSATVTATVLAHGRGKKVEIIKFRRRKHYRRQMGHRQNYTELEITANNGVGAPAGAAKKTKAEDKAPKKAPKKEKSDDGAAAAAAATAAAAAGAGTLKFLDAPNGEGDDLKKILGIGSVLEEKLHGIGVYHSVSYTHLTLPTTPYV